MSMFYEITCIFCRSKLSYFKLYFQKYFLRCLRLRLRSQDVYMKTMAQKVIEQFKKYWFDIGIILATVVILDAQYKMTFLSLPIWRFYGQNSGEVKHVRNKLFTVLVSIIWSHQLFSTTSKLTQMSNIGSCAGRDDNS